MGCSDECIQTGFAKFTGVKRRFTKWAKLAGATVIDDYGHHPVEIRAVLAAAREGVKGRVIAVVQPHRFTRLRDHMADFQTAFNDADMVYAAPVYAAGEAPIDGIDSAALVAGMKARGHRSAQTIAGPDALAEALGNQHRARRHGGLPRRGRHHQMGGRAGRCDCGTEGGMTQTMPRAGTSTSSARADVGARPGSAQPEPVEGRALPSPRGKLTPQAPLAPLVWFKSGGAAEWLFEPKDLADLQAFLPISIRPCR